MNYSEIIEYNIIPSVISQLKLATSYVERK
mgnify:FL=1|jgi:hypothetical protein